MQVLLPSGEWDGIGLNDWPSRACVDYLAARGREANPARVAVTEQGVSTEVDAESVAITGSVLERRGMGRHRVKAQLEIGCLPPVPAGSPP